MKIICCVLVSNHRTGRQAFKMAGQCFKMKKQEQLYFSSELFNASEPERKIMVLEMERHHSISDPNTMFASKKEPILLRHLP